MGRVLVLITGTGRSGTSTMSGTLHHLGLHVPGPFLGANESNPKGFYESRWAVRFHNELTERVAVNIFDGRPEAFDLVQAAITDRDRERLTGFLADRAAGHDQVVVKDPRSVWVQRLWRDAAAAQGLGIRYISMLRHPAEVVGSRTTYYSGQAGYESVEAQRKRKRYEIFNVARWINGSLISERETRGHPRAFVRYTDLLDDWRPALLGLQQDLGLVYDADIAAGGGSAVDEFIDPSLRRHTVTWDDLEVPDDLRVIAQEVWEQLQPLADGHGVSPEASARLDDLAVRYRECLFRASAVDKDRADEAVRVARLEGAEKALAAARSGDLEDRAVHDVTSRELARVLARRVGRRLRR
jgi:hypothetical protein